MTRTQKIWLIGGFVALDLVILAAVLAWVFRDPYRASQASQAQVGEAREASEAADSGAGNLETVVIESPELMFTGSSALGEQPGFFEKVHGEARLAADGSVRSLRATVEMNSVLTNADSLTAKLRSEPGFFEVDKYPTSQFVSTAIRPARAESAAKGATHDIEGNLTIRGITRSLTFPAKIEVSQQRFALSSEFSVNRHWFGVDYDGGTVFPEIRDLVLITLSIDTPRQERGDQPASHPTTDEPATRPAS